MEQKNLLTTPTQRKREQRHATIVAEYFNLCRQYPNAPKWRILGTLGRMYEYTPQGIFQILKRNNVIK